MKGLRLYIPPFAPDQSGAAAVLCELGGLIVVLDAGGCAGNICGFDEPRWFGSRSAIYSAGLRDMDAILGRDDRLVEKIVKACKEISGSFVAVVGTPVPAVIATDYRAIGRMIRKKTGMPAIMIDSNGTGLYDEGEEKAWLELFKTFAGGEDSGREGKNESEMQSPEEKASGRIGVIGLTPLNLGGDYDLDSLKTVLAQVHFDRPVFYGMGAGLSEVARASHVEKNMVVAPGGLAAARWLKDRFGTPYEFYCPPEILPEWKGIENRMAELTGRKVLVVHQQALANAIRMKIIATTDSPVTVASWFQMDRKEMAEGDIALKEEEDWIRLVDRGGYDAILADPLLKRAVPGYQGLWMDLSHFALSGKGIV